MTQAPNTTAQIVASPRSASAKVRSLVVFALGLLLLSAAVWAIASRRDQLQSAWHAARTTQWYLVAAMFLLPLLNWTTTTSIFWVLTRRYGAVRWTEMAALIASAWLLNFLPMRPGMVGRLTYHKKVNAVRVRDSVKVLIAASATTGAAVALLLGIVLMLGAAPSRALLVISIGAPALVLALLTLAARRLKGQAWRWPAAASFRYCDVTVWALRYWIAFMIIGHPVTPIGAAAVTVTGQAAMLAPVQLGLREWVIGATGALLPPEWSPATVQEGSGAMAAIAPGLLADIAMRAVELSIAVPLGLASSMWLFRALRRGTGPERAGQEEGSANPSPDQAL
jgi:hypothetical protein